MNNSRHLVTVLITVALTSSLSAQDWPQWRGPARDGAITSFREPAAWPKTLTRRWQIEIGSGYATPLVVGDRVYVFTRQNEDEVMMALDGRSGKTIWRTSYPAPFKMTPATAPHGPGPKSTPTFADNRIFTLGMSGKVTAFDAASGEVRWSWNGDGPAYGSPLLFNLSGTRQVVTFTQKYFVGVSAANGQLLWQRPFTTPSTTTSQTPILHKNMVIEMGRGNGVTAFVAAPRDGKWTTENIWHTDDVSMHMSDAVVINGVLYGLSHLNSGEYFALDLETGKVLWKSEPRQAAHAAIVRAGNTIFSLEDDSELVVLRHNRTRFEPISRYQVATTATWTQPVISGNRVFVRDVSTLTLWTTD